MVQEAQKEWNRPLGVHEVAGTMEEDAFEKEYRKINSKIEAALKLVTEGTGVDPAKIEEELALATRSGIGKTRQKTASGDDRKSNSLRNEEGRGRKKWQDMPPSTPSNDGVDVTDIGSGDDNSSREKALSSVSEHVKRSGDPDVNAHEKGQGKTSSTVALRGILRQVEKSLYSSDHEKQLIATKKIRQLLSVERDFLIDDVIAHDLIPRLLSFLNMKEESELQVEALWALTNVAAGSSEHTRVLIQKGAIPALVGLMSSSHNEVLEQAVWVLGNLAGDGRRARDEVLNDGALEPLLHIINSNDRLSLLRISTWALSNICDGQPQTASYSQMKKSKFDLPGVLNALSHIIYNEDTEVQSHGCWALSHLCDGPSPFVEEVVASNVCAKLIELLEHRSWRVSKPALRTIGNIVCAEDDQQDYTQHIVNLKAVDRLKSLVGHSNREIQKEACWTLSNIAAGTVEQIEEVLNSGVIPTLIKLTTSGKSDPEVKIEASWVLLNATSCGSSDQIQFLANAGCVGVLCTLLTDAAMALMALEGLEKILLVGEETPNLQQEVSTKKEDAVGPASSSRKGVDGGLNRFAQLVDTSQIAMLQESLNPGLAKRAARLWKRYFVCCAICSKAYGKNTADTFFCQECKCTVCKACDCTKFHLSYQLSQWDELYAEEESGKTSKAKKKSKKKKKKKEKAAASKETKKEPAVPEVEAEQDERKRPVVAALPVMSKKEEQPRKDLVARKPTLVDEEAEEDDTDEDAAVGKGSNQASASPDIKGNDQYVDYLSQGGSIFELAKMLDLDRASSADSDNHLNMVL